MGCTISFKICFLFLALLAYNEAHQPAVPKLRPPSVPLVTHDPYFSIWSGADKLTDDATRHWTRAKHSLVSLIRIDNKCYRLMGDEPKSLAPMEQSNLQV